MLMHCNAYVNTHGILLRGPLGYLVSAHFTGIDQAQEGSFTKAFCTH